MSKSIGKHEQLRSFTDKTTEQSIDDWVGKVAEWRDCGERQSFEKNSCLHRCFSSNQKSFSGFK